MHPWEVDFRHLILPEAQSSTSPLESRHWFALCIWASASGIPKKRCLRTALSSALSAHACSGSDGSDSTPAAHSAREASLRVHSWPHTSRPLQPRLDGPRPNGFATANPACWAEFLEPLPDS